MILKKKVKEGHRDLDTCIMIYKFLHSKISKHSIVFLEKKIFKPFHNILL